MKKQRVENFREIALLNEFYELHSKILDEKFQVRAEKFLLYATVVCEKASVHCWE